MNSTLVLAARRSAIVPRNGAFAALPFEALASPVLEAVMQDAGINARDVDELVVSNALGSEGTPPVSLPSPPACRNGLQG